MWRHWLHYSSPTIQKTWAHATQASRSHEGSPDLCCIQVVTGHPTHLPAAVGARTLISDVWCWAQPHHWHQQRSWRGLDFHPCSVVMRNIPSGVNRSRLGGELLLPLRREKVTPHLPCVNSNRILKWDPVSPHSISQCPGFNQKSCITKNQEDLKLNEKRKATDGTLKWQEISEWSDTGI